MPRKFRTLPTTEPPSEPIQATSLPELPPEPEPAPALASRPLAELEFFDHLRMMPARDWEERICYLYRGGGEVVKADPNRAKFIDKIAGPFDEAYVKEKFGGGRYMVILKNLKLGDAERKYSFEIDGAPKLQPDEILRPGAAPRALEETSTPAPGLQQLAEKLLGELSNELKAKRADGAGDDAAGVMADTMRRACDAAIQMVKDARPAAAATGDPIQQFSQMLGVLKELGLVGDRRSNPAPSLRDLFGMLREELGIDPKALLTGGGGAAPDWRAALVGQAPGILATIRQALDVMDRHQQMNFQAAMQRVNAAPVPQAPALPAAAASVPAVGDATAAAATPSPTPLPSGFAPATASAAFTAPGRNADGSLDFDWIRHFLVRQFRKDGTGEFVGELLAEMFPDAVPLFTSAFGDADALLTFVKSDPVLAEIASHAQGDGFIRDFAAALAPPAAPAEPSAA